jgi:putative flippase GtrA
MNRLFEIRALTNHRILRFLSVGMLNTIFGYAVYAILLFVNVPYLIALFIATVAGVIFNYFSFGRLVFRGLGGRVVFGKFIITYVIVYISNAVLLDLLTKNLIFSPYVGQVICIPLSVLLSWILMNKWVYKKDGCNVR